MTLPDFINGSFELGGSVMICRHIRRLYIDKMVRGVDWGAAAFFTTWGLWNLWYYPSLDQHFSFIGGIAIVAANTVWLAQMLYYIRRERISGVIP